MADNLAQFRAEHGDPTSWSLAEFDQWLTASDSSSVQQRAAREAAAAATDAAHRASEAAAALQRAAAAQLGIGGRS